MTPSDAPPWGDQVVRLEAFLAAHPNVEIMTPLATRSVWWKAIRTGEVYAIENDLRLLLDTLERKLAGPWQK
ncbi:MAG TPA: hypothetical protein VGI96_27955 [Streptosporangiaceae bacterium]